MALLDAIKSVLAPSQPQQTTQFGMPIMQPQTGILPAINAFLAAQPGYQQASMGREKLQAAQLENQNMPLYNALRNQLLQQQGAQLGIQNQYLPKTLQGDIDYKRALMSRIPYENALTRAQIGVANRGANAPYSNAGEIMADYNRVVKQYGANSPEAQATANLIQASIKQQNAVMGLNEEGMPVAIGGSNPAVNTLTTALARIGAPVAQQGLQQYQQQPELSVTPGDATQPQPVIPQQQSVQDPGIYLKSGMTGSARGGAGATYVNPVTKETITSPTTADVSDMQERMRAIESVLPILEELKTHGKGSFGPPIIGDTGNAYTSSLNKGIDTYVVASNLPKTGEGIATARGVLQRGRTETEKHYLDRIDALKNDLTTKYSRYQDVLRRGYRSGDRASNDTGNPELRTEFSSKEDFNNYFNSLTPEQKAEFRRRVK